MANPEISLELQLRRRLDCELVPQLPAGTEVIPGGNKIKEAAIGRYPAMRMGLGRSLAKASRAQRVLKY